MHKKNIVNNGDRNLLKNLNIVIFGGGSAQREVTHKLINFGANITRIVSSIDDGGNSGVLRKAFGIIPVGDIRSALTGMAEVSDCPPSIVELLKLRISLKTTNKKILEKIIELISNDDLSTKRVPEEMLTLFRDYLSVFIYKFFNIDNNEKYSLINSSIGNLILVGAYFKHHKNINLAIIEIINTCKIKGSVWPAMLDGCISLGAIFDDGSILIGESNLTNLNRNINRRAVKKIFLNLGLYDEIRPISVKANPYAIESIRNADVIIFGPGSFFTSILPHMLVKEIVDATSDSNAPKILIGNIREDNETYNLNLEEIVSIFLDTALKTNNFASTPSDFLTHIVANRYDYKDHPNGEIKRYLQSGQLESLCNIGITNFIKNYEKSDKMGFHDSRLLVSDIIEIIKKYKLE